MSDASMAAIARDLVEALKDVAYERNDASKARMASLHTSLCAERRAEIEEARVEKVPQ